MIRELGAKKGIFLSLGREALSRIAFEMRMRVLFTCVNWALWVGKCGRDRSWVGQAACLVDHDVCVVNCVCVNYNQKHVVRLYVKVVL